MLHARGASPHPPSSPSTGPPADETAEKAAAHKRWQEVAKKLALLKDNPQRYRELYGLSEEV